MYKSERLIASVTAVAVAAIMIAAFMISTSSAQNPPNTDTYFYTPGGGGVNGALGMCLNAQSQAVPCNASGVQPTPVTALSFGAYPKASITRSANTTTYTANTGWNNGTPTFFSFANACRVNGGQVLVPQIDIWSSANPTLKLQGILWLFSGVPGTNVSDNATFNIAAADYANLTGGYGGFPFTLTAVQGSGAANSGVSLTGTTYQMQCPAGTTTITGMVQVVNAYVPASGEVLHAGLGILGTN